MTTVWIYPAEILPLKIRAKGASLAAAADFLGNFLVVEVTPVGLQNIGWRFYLVWAVLNLVNAVVVFVFYPETGAVQLEAVDRLFVGKAGGVLGGGVGGGDSSVERQEEGKGHGLPVYDISDLDGKWYRKLQWSKVGESIAASRASRRRMAAEAQGGAVSADDDGRWGRSSATDVDGKGGVLQGARKASDLPGYLHVEPVGGSGSSRSGSGSEIDQGGRKVREVNGS